MEDTITGVYITKSRFLIRHVMESIYKLSVGELCMVFVVTVYKYVNPITGKLQIRACRPLRLPCGLRLD